MEIYIGLGVETRGKFEIPYIWLCKNKKKIEIKGYVLYVKEENLFK